MANDNKIKLIFATTSGDVEGEFPLDQPLKAVEKRVLAEAKLDPSQADDFVVTLNGRLLDESKKLLELGLAECDVLTIERRNVVKI